jgi:hypothetical protein
LLAPFAHSDLLSFFSCFSSLTFRARLETLLKVSINLERKHKKCEVESMFFHARTARDGPSCAVPTFRTIRRARRRTRLPSPPRPHCLSCLRHPPGSHVAPVPHAPATTAVLPFPAAQHPAPALRMRSAPILNFSSPMQHLFYCYNFCRSTFDLSLVSFTYT